MGGLQLAADLEQLVREAGNAFGQAITGPTHEMDTLAQTALDRGYAAAQRLVGAYLGWLAIATGSLVPVMVLHALLDLRILFLPLDAVPPPVPPPAEGSEPGSKGQ